MEESTVIVTMPCPECKAVHNTLVELKPLVYVKQYQTTPKGIEGTTQFIKLYQCPCCKTVYTEETNQENEVWKLKFAEIMKSYNLT